MRLRKSSSAEKVGLFFEFLVFLEGAYTRSFFGAGVKEVGPCMVDSRSCFFFFFLDCAKPPKERVSNRITKKVFVCIASALVTELMPK